jgi:Ni,Fe-hydrogenase maturation factor
MTTEKITDSIEKLFNSTSNNYIFIYTPPKVGSTTLVSSLRVSLGRSYNIIHIHDEVMLSVLTGNHDVSVNSIIHHLAENGKNVYVIDVYRTPIERKMSEFFEKISPYHFNNSEENINNYSLKRICIRFNKIFPHIENNDHYFDKYNIGNPVPFDFENKYTIQIVNNIKYVKLRLCDSQLWQQILSTIFQTDIVLISDYQTDKKKIGEIYTKFKTEYKIPENFFESIKSCKYFKFYYSIPERNEYLNFWKNRIDKAFTPYSPSEFIFYMQICLENQYINDVQIEHYIDNGCFCNYCSLKRRDIFFRAKKGETNFDKIIHTDIVHEVKENRIKKLNEIIQKKIKEKISNKKFIKNQFSISIK